MNDVTKKLAHQAFEFAYRTCKEVDHDVGDNDTIFVSFAMGRYHELIVQECANLFKNVYTTVETDHGHATVVASDYIRKHFGVEQ